MKLWLCGRVNPSRSLGYHSLDCNRLAAASFIEHKCLIAATERAQWMVNRFSAPGSDCQSQRSPPATKKLITLPGSASASVLLCVIHTYVSLMRRLSVSQRKRESGHAFLNVKPLWLKKHTPHYTCIYNLRRHQFGWEQRWEGLS